MRCLAHSGLHGGAVRCGSNAGITLIASDNRVHGIEDGDVNDRHRTARTPRSKLFPENPVLARRYRRVIQPAGVDGDLVPVTDRVCPGPRFLSGARARTVVWTGPVERTQRLAMTVRESGRILSEPCLRSGNGQGHYQHLESFRCDFHRSSFPGCDSPRPDRVAMDLGCITRVLWSEPLRFESNHVQFVCISSAAKGAPGSWFYDNRDGAAAHPFKREILFARPGEGEIDPWWPERRH